MPCAAKTAAKKKPVLSPFEQAVAARDALENKPNGQATRAEYNAVMDQFRTIYHANPADLHAPDSVFAVAELLSEAGEQLNDKKLSQDAVGQYEFLRKNYPASHYRADCLLAEAAIEANDLQDFATAKSKYQELIKTYPHSDRVPQAQAALTALKHGQRAASTAAITSAPVPIQDTTMPAHLQPAAPVTALPPSETAPSPPVDAVLPAFDKDKDMKRSGPARAHHRHPPLVHCELHPRGY